MRTHHEFIAVDWGTTNRRAYLVNRDGSVLDEMEDSLGVLSVPEGGFPGSIDDITRRLGNRPLLLAGMIGSTRGWRETDYVSCPAGIDDLAAQLEWVVPGTTAIVPGLSFIHGDDGDVMRGEEVQVFGLLRGPDGKGQASICHPGTHTKWISTRDGAIDHFRTVMTGELFSLLREHSILAPLLQAEPAADRAFFDGVSDGFADGDLSAQLFGIRAKVLLSLLDEQDASSYASGLLIGCDIKAGLPGMSGRDIIVLGRPSLTALYAAALEHCGMQAREADGASAFVAGMVAIRESLA